MSNEERFISLFKGYSGAHGQTTVLDSQREGKKKAKSFIVREPLTLGLVREHLGGKRGVGSIPIDETNSCHFGALDIDDYNLDLVALYKKVEKLKLPLVMCRSKSGGAHLFLFMAEKTPASEIRDKLAEFASALGWGTCEIFPKQEEVIVERGDVGNFINLPYFNAQFTTRYALDKKGESLTLEEFLDRAEGRRVTFKELSECKIGVGENVLPNGPPCLQQIAEYGIPEGGRNNTLLNIGVYYRMVDPENWKQLLEKANQQYCSPPLPATEIVTIQRQLEKKEYIYTCKQEPLHSHCNRALCRTRKFGIGNGQSAATVGGLTVVQSEPPVWFIDVDGSRLELSTKQLQMQVEFQRACMEQMYKMPAKQKESDWRDLVDQLLENATRISVPEELTHKGQFNELLEMFCTSRIKAQSPEELLTGKPWTDEGVTYFKLSGLQEFLKRHNFTSYTRGQVTERLKELNNGDASNKEYRFKDNKDNWKKVRVWFIPEIDKGEVDLPEVTFEEQDVPF
jgi:hypothetical protein